MRRTLTLVKHGRPQGAFRIIETGDLRPGRGEVRIQVEYSGLNFADVMARQGLYPDAPPLPSVLGYEVVGRIDSVGEGALQRRVGERVLAFTRFGGYASQLVVSELTVIPIPEDMDGASATALATQYTTGYFAAEEMVKLHSGDRVLIQAAAGGVGVALVQLAKRKGCTVIGLTGSSSKIGFLRELGVDHPLDSSTGDWVKEVQGLVGPKGLDVAFDSLGGKPARQAWKLLGSGGRLVCFGVAGMAGNRKNVFRSLGTVAGFGLLSPLEFLMQSKALIGVNMLRIADSRPESLARSMGEVVNLAARGELKPHVGKVFAAEEIAEAHDYLGSRQSIGKVAVKWATGPGTG